MMVTRLNLERASDEDEIKGLKAQIERLQHQVDLMRTPCRCDPLGSWEEFCNGGCELREHMTEMKRLLEHWYLYGMLNPHNGIDNYSVYKRTAEIAGYQLWTNLKIIEV